MLSRPLAMLVRLLARSSAGWPPVEVAGAGYRPQVALFAPAAGGCAVLAEDVRFGRVPAHTAVGVEVSDRHRIWSVPTAAPAQIGDGAQVLIPAGSLRVCYVGPPAATGDGRRAATGGAARRGSSVSRGLAAEVCAGGVEQVGAVAEQPEAPVAQVAQQAPDLAVGMRVVDPQGAVVAADCAPAVLPGVEAGVVLRPDVVPLAEPSSALAGCVVPLAALRTSPASAVAVDGGRGPADGAGCGAGRGVDPGEAVHGANVASPTDLPVGTRLGDGGPGRSRTDTQG